MTHLGYLIAGWSISLAVIATYIYFILRRGRDLVEQVPKSRRRWMTSDSSSTTDR